jgi:hypothetical protein
LAVVGDRGGVHPEAQVDRFDDHPPAAQPLLEFQEDVFAQEVALGLQIPEGAGDEDRAGEPAAGGGHGALLWGGRSVVKTGPHAGGRSAGGRWFRPGWSAL